MIPVEAIIKETGFPANERARRQYNRLKKEVGKKALLWWHRQRLRVHFTTPEHARRLWPGVYKERSKDYQKKKLKAKGHSRLLEWSGETRTSVTNFKRTGGTAKKQWIRMAIPRMEKQTKGGQWQSRPKKQLEKELTAISPAEEKKIAAYYKKELIREINKLKRITSTRKVR